MTFLLVTVAWRGRRRDLAVPADVPIADLLRPLAAAMCRGDPSPSGPSPTGPSPSGPSPTGRRLALAPLGGAPLPAHRTLAACEVGDGAVLVLLE
jgi:hypothetical protein